MTPTEKAFYTLLKKKDCLEKTGMKKFIRSQWKAYFENRDTATKRKPKVETMEHYLKEYGFTKVPEKWILN